MTELTEDIDSSQSVLPKIKTEVKHVTQAGTFSFGWSQIRLSGRECWLLYSPSQGHYHRVLGILNETFLEKRIFKIETAVC